MDNPLQVLGILAVGAIAASTVLGVYHGDISSLIPFWVSFGIDHPKLTAFVLIAIAAVGGTLGIQAIS